MMPYQYEQDEVRTPIEIRSRANEWAAKGWKLVSALPNPTTSPYTILIFEKWVEPPIPDGSGPYR